MDNNWLHSTIRALSAATVMCTYFMLEEDDEDDAKYTPEDVELMVRHELKQRTKKRRQDSGDTHGDNDATRKKRYIEYDRERASMCVNADYFCPRPKFDDRQFERFFRITRGMAEYILQQLALHDTFWTQTYDARNRMSNAPQVKLLAALKMVSYGESFSAWQDYFQMGESTARECCSKLMKGLVTIEAISGVYLRKMTKADAQKVEQLHFENHNIHGMLGSLDVMQVPWGNCPSGQKGQHIGKSGEPTLALEAAADYNLWIWHWCFGSPGSLNDINTWERSSMLHDMTHGRMHEIDFDYKINGESFSLLYYLVDLIYPQITRFVRAIAVPVTRIDRYYTSKHDAARKDIERAFGVFEKKYHCVTHPIQLFYVDDIHYLIGGCIVMHNMMVEHRIKNNQIESESFYELASDNVPNYHPPTVTKTAAAEKAIADRDAYFEANAALADLNNDVVDLELRDELREAQILTRNLRFVQYYWKELTNTEEHLRLQNAIKHQLYKDRYGQDTDGDELASFDPFE